MLPSVTDKEPRELENGQFNFVTHIKPNLISQMSIFQMVSGKNT